MKLSGNRKTALTLVIAILLVELLATKQLQSAWTAMWGPVLPLGSGMKGTAPTSSGSSSSQTQPPNTTAEPSSNIQQL